MEIEMLELVVLARYLQDSESRKLIAIYHSKRIYLFPITSALLCVKR